MAIDNASSTYKEKETEKLYKLMIRLIEWEEPINKRKKKKG